MKLLTKTTLYFLVAMIPLLAATGFYLFNRFSKEINHSSDRELISQEIQWIRYLETEAGSGVTFILRTPDISIFPVDGRVNDVPAIKDVYAYSKSQSNKIPYRQLEQVVAINGSPYQIIIRQSQEQKAVLVADVTRIMLFVFAGLFAATLIFNWMISERLWKPFRNSLNKIRSAELEKIEGMHFEKTNTKEFNELNASLNYMTRKIHKDYENMKEFTENAAHEMKTPVAVVQSKLELLLQDSNLREEQVQSILQSVTALNRLSKLNEALLLLAKIENHQYETREEISLAEITKKYLSLFQEFINEKQLKVRTSFNEDFNLTLHPVLAGSLVTNLLGNAIKYNYENGTVEIEVTDDCYRISNTGRVGEIPADKLFKRMHSSPDEKNSSNGLGLAIVKKIIDVNNLTIQYRMQNGIHTFEIRK